MKRYCIIFLPLICISCMSLEKKQSFFRDTVQPAASDYSDPVDATAEDYESIFPDETWELVWADEFESNGPPDPEKWRTEIRPRGEFDAGDFSQYGQINSEMQAFTDNPENVRVENGLLVLETRDSGGFRGISSGRVETFGKIEFLYGRIDVKARLPEGLGMWPAIFMFPTTFPGVENWPQCGEIDIMEQSGVVPEITMHSVHTGRYNWKRMNHYSNYTELNRPQDEFHIYTLEWTPEDLSILVDGTVYFNVDKEKDFQGEWPFDKPYYLVLHVAYGGIWGGILGVDRNVLPQRMEIDYVRYYQNKEDHE